jgi:mono/diheme cytochrome c family protein
MKDMRNWHVTGLLGAIAIVTAFGLAAPVAAQQPASDPVADGARVYGAMCGRCHNPRSPLENTDRDWVTIANHMRVRGNLTGDQVRNVVAFLQATNTDPQARSPLGVAPAGAQAPEGLHEGPASTDPALIARGETLVAERACVGCHVIGTAGGQVGPTLNRTVGRRGPGFVRRKIVEPTFDNATSMMPNFALTPEEVEAIVAYLNTLDGK